jgi:hypothetical protein
MGCQPVLNLLQVGLAVGRDQARIYGGSLQFIRRPSTRVTIPTGAPYGVRRDM